MIRWRQRSQRRLDPGAGCRSPAQYGQNAVGTGAARAFVLVVRVAGEGPAAERAGLARLEPRRAGPVGATGCGAGAATRPPTWGNCQLSSPTLSPDWAITPTSLTCPISV